MATTHQDTNVNQLVINKMTKQEYDNLSQVSDTELYLVEEQVDNVVTQNSTNPVQSGAVYEALQQSSSNIKDGTTTFTKNNETIGTTSANQSVNQTITLPNDVVMCNLIDNKALASYATPITRFKYIEDHGWVDMDRSNIQYNEGTGEWTGTFVSLDITEGEYYYDMDNDTVFVADENSEMQDVTSTVIIQGDSNKLYCDTTTNMLYRYDGTDFIALTSNFSGDYNDLNNKPLSVESNKVKYTLSDGTTKLTLAQEGDLKTVAFSGSYNDLINRPFQNVYFTFPDYKKYALLIDVTDWYDNNTETNYSYNLFANVFCVRTFGNSEPSGTFNVAAKANWKRGYLLKYSRNTYFSVAIVEYNSHKYIALYKSNNSSTNVYMHGYMTSLLSTPLYVTDDDVSKIFSGTEY